jgi:hypothetical protein
MAPLGKVGVTHQFRVFTVNAAGTSPSSNTSSVRVVHILPRPSITGVFATMTDNASCAATVVWAGDSSAGGYILEYTLSLALNWTQKITIATRAGFEGLLIGVEYQFRVTPFVNLENGQPVDLGVTSYIQSQFMAVAPYDKVLLPFLL